MQPEPFEANRGYNPAFLQRVREKRRLQRAAHAAREPAPAARAESERTAEEMRRRAELRFAEMMQELASGRRRPRALDIIAAVAFRHGLTSSDLTGPSRKHAVVAARHEAIYEARRLRPDLSMPALGRIFGGQDHTTILNALRRHAERRRAG